MRGTFSLERYMGESSDEGHGRIRDVESQDSLVPVPVSSHHHKAVY